MATKNKRFSYGYRPTQYQKHGYFAPTEDRLYRQMNDEDNGRMFELEPVQPFLRVAAEEQMNGYRPNGQGARPNAPQPSREPEAVQGYRTTAYFDDFDPKGMSRDEVRKVQRTLNENGAMLAEDGIWGPKSQRAMDEYRSALESRPEEGEAAVPEPVAERTEASEVPAGTPAEETRTAEDDGEEEKRKKADREKMFVDAYGAIVPSFFSRMMDISKPTQYVTADDRMRSAGRLARSVAPFADSGFAKNIYADARNRETMMGERANKGEENVLQRRTTAENMWGHYSPAITQALTNASVFMQRAYQADEEAAKLESLAEAKKIEAQENENILRSRFDQVKTNFYMNGKPISFDEFKQLVSTGQTGLLKSRGKISNEKISALAKEFQTVVTLNNEKTQLEEAAKKQRNMAAQAHQIADVNSRFAEESHAHFGFPTIKLSGLLQNKGRVDYPTPKGTRETLDEQMEDVVAGAQVKQQPVVNQNITTGYAPGSQTGTRRKAVPSDRVKAIQTLLNKNGYSVDVDGIWGPKTEAAFKDFNGTGTEQKKIKVTVPNNEATRLMNEGYEYSRKFQSNADADAFKHDAKTVANRSNEQELIKFEAASEAALEDNTNKMAAELSQYMFNEYQNRKNATSSKAFKLVDPRMHSFNTGAVRNLFAHLPENDSDATTVTNIIDNLQSGKYTPEQAQEAFHKITPNLYKRGLILDTFKIYVDGKNVMVIPRGMMVVSEDDGTRHIERVGGL